MKQEEGGGEEAKSGCHLLPASKEERPLANVNGAGQVALLYGLHCCCGGGGIIIITIEAPSNPFRSLTPIAQQLPAPHTAC